MFTRKARLQDAQNIYDLVHSLSGDGTLLPRDFAVAVIGLDVGHDQPVFLAAQHQQALAKGDGTAALFPPSALDPTRNVINVNQNPQNPQNPKTRKL